MSDLERPAMLSPGDEHNQNLMANVHPAGWRNPVPAARYDLVVIGAGTAGLVTAAGAAGLGAKVALIERALMGGDCLNFGCVPSKALIRSARMAAEIRAAEHFGIQVPPGVAPDFPAVMQRMRRLRAQVSPNDSAERFANLGVDVFFGQAAFADRCSVGVGGQTLRFRRAVIASGSRAAPAPIAGLQQTGCLTNETIFNLTERPRRLAVIGGGPIGCELAQAFRRLDCDVVLFHKNRHLLDREDDDAAALLEHAFARERIQVFLKATVTQVESAPAGKLLHYQADGVPGRHTVDEILLAAGRVPNVEGLNLEAAGVVYDTRAGVKVNDRLQTSNARIYAAGDICLPWKFTHAADFGARLVIQNALFLGRKSVSSLTVPWCTYTDPEIARVGINEHDARERGLAIDTFVREFQHVDRAVLDGDTRGFLKIHVKKNTDRILGATIVSPHAGQLIGEIGVAMAGGLGLGKLASVIHPYPTQGEAIRQLGDAYNRTRLTPRVKWLLAKWLAWMR